MRGGEESRRVLNERERDTSSKELVRMADLGRVLALSGGDFRLSLIVRLSSFLLPLQDHVTACRVQQ